MEGFKLIGIKLSKKTSNLNGASAKDCGALWQEFSQNNLAATIPGKVDDTVYAVYYDYDSDEKGAFSYFIGCKVTEETPTPPHLEELNIPSQQYWHTTAKGVMPTCIGNAWQGIWNMDIKRQFGFDFEVYDERSQDWQHAEVDIYLSIRE
jgi:predicted transcriptional regulator YdeE